MAQNTENPTESNVGADEPRALVGFRLSSSMRSALKEKCKSLRMNQGAVIEAFVEAFLSDRISIVDGQAVGQGKVA
jgi:hypothetical protein|tara:strand:+ start:273 stop:500 length:228 start_codon:yes stop_codon:yes gene_type:complete